MSFHRMTTISGYKPGYQPPTAPLGSQERFDQIAANQPYSYCTVRRGHWSPTKAAAVARRAGVTTDLEVEWSSGDRNGLGYGGVDRRWEAVGDALVEVPVAAWEAEIEEA